MEDGKISMENLAADEFHAAITAWQQAMFGLCIKRSAEWCELRDTVRIVYAGPVLRALHAHLSAQRLTVDPATAKLHGKAIATLDAYLKSEPSLSEHPARQVVNL